MGKCYLVREREKHEGGGGWKGRKGGGIVDASASAATRLLCISAVVGSGEGRREMNEKERAQRDRKKGRARAVGKQWADRKE